MAALFHPVPDSLHGSIADAAASNRANFRQLDHPHTFRLAHSVSTLVHVGSVGSRRFAVAVVAIVIVGVGSAFVSLVFVLVLLLQSSFFRFVFLCLLGES